MHNRKENPVDLRSRYGRTLEISFVIALLFLCSMFFAFQKHESSFELPDVELDNKTIEVIPPTVHPKKRKPRPTIPVPDPLDEEENELEEDTIIKELFVHETDLFPPDPEDDIIYEYVGVQEKPKLKYYEAPKYPEIPRKAGIEGRVVITVVISEKGKVLSASFLKGHEMLKDASLEAAKKCIFSPARQNDKYVKVKMSIPFDFRLN